MFQKIQEAVQQLNREYMQAFAATKETCSQDLQRIPDFLEGYCEQHAEGGRGRVSTRNTGNYSGDFWTASFYMACIRMQGSWQ